MRKDHLVACLAAAGVALPVCAQQEEDLSETWRVYADCAAAYAGSVLARRSDPTPTPELADIGRQAADYEAAAARVRQAEKGSSTGESDRVVREHVEANVARFLAMDDSGELAAFIEACPQPDDEERG